MDLHKKAMWIFVGAILITMVILASVSVLFIRANYLNLESNYVRSDVNLVSKNIDSEIKNLKSNTPDWGAWEDTYAFVLGEKPDYVEVNLVNTTFRTLRASFIIITDKEGRIRYGEGYDLISDTPVPLRPDLVTELGKGRILTQTLGSGTEGVAGFISLPEGPVILSSYPVLHSDYTGPAQGMVIIGRQVDDAEIRLLTEGTVPVLSILPFDSSSTNPDDRALLAGTGDAAISVHPLDENAVEGKKILRDIYGSDTLLLSVQLPRDIYHEGNQTLFVFILLQFGIVIVLGITGMVILDRTVLARLTAIDSEITVINENRDQSARIKITGDDEISRLAGSMNTLLDEVEHSHVQLVAAYQSASQANRKLKLLSSITRHDITNQLTSLDGYLSILEKKQPDTKLGAYIQGAVTAEQRILAMIQFTKEYESIGVKEPAWQDCSILVDTAIKQAPQGNVRITNDLQAGAEILADPLIVKVFYNLIDNAVRYGGKITTIQFSPQESGNNFLIVCEDDGIGVPADEKERIFERGFGKNTGLGLFLAREILDITGITIKETGEPGKGARFEIIVPKGAYRFTTSGITIQT